MSNESTALPRFAISRLCTANTSPSTTTLPDSSVSSRMGVTLLFLAIALPMRTFSFAFFSSFFCSGAGYSARMVTPCSRNCAARCCSRLERSAGAGMRENHACTVIVMLSRRISTSSTSALSSPPHVSRSGSQPGNISRNGTFSLMTSSLRFESDRRARRPAPPPGTCPESRPCGTAARNPCRRRRRSRPRAPRRGR